MSLDVLYHRCDPESFSFESTADLRPLRGVVGQKRALRAIEFGLGIRKRGYNIFVVGPSGCGKTSTVSRLLRKRAEKEPVSDDICYVYHFDEPSRPRVISLPAGQGPALAEDMDQLVAELRRQIPKVLGSRTLARRRAELMAAHRMSADRLQKKLVSGASRESVWVQQEEDRLVIAPVVDGEPISPDDFEKLPSRVQRELQERLLTFQQRIANFERERSKMEREVQQKIIQEERAAIEPFVKALVGEVRAKHEQSGVVVQDYLDEVERFVLENHFRFLGQDAQSGDEAEEVADQPFDSMAEGGIGELKVNVLVSRARDTGAPFIYEQNPTAQELVGYLEYREQRGALQTDHTLIRAGALHRAQGGYLVIQALDLLRRPGSWDALKQVLEHQVIKVEDGRDDGQHRLAGSVTPEPAKVDIKVVLIGTMDAYQTFTSLEPDFARLFKVRAEFEESWPRNRRSEMHLARFLARLTREEGYLAFTKDAVARVVEFSSREADQRDKLTARLSSIVDLVSESDFWARRSGRKMVTVKDVEQALVERRYRGSRFEDLILEDVRRGQLLIETKGRAVGRVNGIAVYDTGDISFGVPSRITARVFAGTQGVVSLDREVALSGPIHNKGAMILAGFLGGRFGGDTPLAMSASLTFEQSYEEVDGDSASAAELFAIMSCLSGIPLNQGIAVTGSVNQEGGIQPIGGVNQKIEGTFRVCRLQGLDGQQGVIIPRANLGNLMLHRDVLEAVKKRKFHIWAISTVDEGIEILTGLPAGRRLKSGKWTPGSVNEKIAARLQELADIARKAGISDRR